MKVLVIDDAVEYRHAVSTIARQQGHQVRTAASYAEALNELSAVPPDLIVLDLSLPDGDGLDLCQEIRKRSSAYILMLTGRDDEVDKLIGFRLGADDYVTKPFSPRELGARIDALSRRQRPAAELPDERRFGRLTIRVQARETLVDDAAVELTKIEFDLIEAFTAHPKAVLTRAQLLERVWGENWYGDDHVVDVHVANLRRKLAGAGASKVIRTLRGVGYGLVAEPG